uniref:Uncharacterized protein n=1 Tax=Timema monikensis TaxID=170555 RepID=A0A7R9HUW4_9NEOP|nr:unnamed protein product [Timema monikensis]
MCTKVWSISQSTRCPMKSLRKTTALLRYRVLGIKKLKSVPSHQTIAMPCGKKTLASMARVSPLWVRVSTMPHVFASNAGAIVPAFTHPLLP